MSAIPSLTDMPLTDAQGRPTILFQIAWQRSFGQALAAGQAQMPSIVPINIYCDYTGTPLTGQLPVSFAAQRLLNGVDLSSTTRWFIAIVSGSIACSIAQTGVVTVTGLSASSVIQIRSLRDNFSIVVNVVLNKIIGPPPATGTGGGTSSSSSTFNNFNAATMASVSPEITCTVGSTGAVNLQATLTVSTGAVSPAGTFFTLGIWRWFNGTSYVDVSTEQTSSMGVEVTQDPVHYFYSTQDDSLTISSSKTGLTAGTVAKFQLYARNSSGTRTMTLRGTATATGA